MAVEAVASVVIQKLTDMLQEESIMHQKVIVDQLKEIKDALESKGGWLFDAEVKQTTDPEVKKWADEYLRHLYDVEDTIETFALRFARQRKRLGFLMNHALFLKNFTACRSLSWKIRRIRGQINKLNRKQPPSGVKDASVKSTSKSPRCIPRAASASNYDKITNGNARDQKEEEEEEADNVGELQMEASDNSGRPISQPARNGLRQVSSASLYAERLRQSKLMYSYSYNEEELDIVGFKQYVNDLVKILTEPTTNTSSTPHVVSIVGPRGSGKTTLAHAVYGQQKIKQTFKSEAWVTVCKDCNPIVALLHKLLKQVDQDGQISSTDEQTLKSRLKNCLKDKMYFIVLDDFGSSEIMWDNLQDAFPDQGNGSKILLTCQEGVATNIHLSNPFILKKLSDPESWDLFLRKAGLEGGPENLKQKILEVCSGLPQNIVLLGSLLSTKAVGKWHDYSFLSTQAYCETKDVISLSYDDLPAHLKLCLLYMVLFPKEFDVPVRRLQRLWLAEGFVKRPESPDKSSFLEDEAKKYFEDLVKRSLIQVSKLTSDGSPKRCRLLGVLHDHLVPKAEVISLFHVHYKPDNCKIASPFGARRLVQRTDIKNCDTSQLGSLRSYLSFNSQYRDTPAQEVGHLLKNMIGNGLRLLRVLDLEGVYKPSLPENLGDFFHLRYLGLRWTFLDALPQSVGQLYYLEALDIKHTYINTLPKFIWKLKHLKHISANGIRLDLPSRHLHSSLPQLLTLWGFSVDDKSLVKDGLNSLRHVRELDITFNLSNTETEELLDWISKLEAIQTLRLRSRDDIGRPSKLILRPLDSLKQLTHLKLLGNLSKLPERGDFPQEVKVLTLSVSQLKDDPMPILGELPKLTVLRLLAKSYLGKKMRCPREGFKELRVLKLWMLKNLEQWDVEDGAMKRMEELDIRCCDRLGMIPCRLLQQRTFKKLTLTNMPEEFKKKVEETKHNVFSLIPKRYKFSPLPWEEADDSSDGVNSMLTNHNGHAS